MQEQEPFQTWLGQNWYGKHSEKSKQMSCLSELLFCVFNQKDHSHTSTLKLLPLLELVSKLPLFLKSLQHKHLLKETWKLPFKVNEVVAPTYQVGASVVRSNTEKLYSTYQQPQT